ncbi:MAG TPA: ADOP family duplicated permease [Gammaproteobacteria bacterium]|nr:ADOP family duplicated permease [Gammaproteobacteria bacterium]
MLQAIEHALADLRYAARRLRNAPGFFVVSTLLIAVSLASTTVIFGLVDVVLLRSLPVRDPASLVQLFELRPAMPAFESFGEELRERVAAESTTLTDVMGETSAAVSLEREATTSRVDVGLVTPNYFDGLGLRATLGRTLGSGDDVAGERLAVLSHAAWTRFFGREVAAVGGSVRLAGQPYRIVGVLEQGITGTSVDSGPDVLVLAANRADFPQAFPFTKVLARLREGVSLEAADAEIRTIWARQREVFLEGVGGVVGDFDRELSVELRSIARGTSRVREQFQPTLLLLFVGTGLVLGMVCVNVGGLLLARIAQARRDAALRRVLGASRVRIAIQWTVESVLIAAIGGGVGLAVAAAAMPPLVGWLAPRISFGGFGRPPTLDVSFDWRIAGFGIAAMLATGLLAALVPTLWWTRRDTYAALKASIDDRETRRVQSALSVVQIAMTTVLLLGGGLLIHTLDRLQAVDAGFDRELLVRFAIDPGLADYDGPAHAALQRRLLEETARLPAVQAAAITQSPVMQGLGAVMVLTPPGGPPEVDSAWNTTTNSVTAGYFAAMGIELLSGATVDDEVVADGPRSIVVNAAFARRFFGDENVVGRELDMGREFKTPVFRIVGVVGDASFRSLREANPPIFYTNPLSYAPQPTSPGAFSLLVRTTTPDAIIGTVRALIRSIDPALPVLDAVTMTDEVNRSLWRERLAAALTSAFAMVGLGVAAIGLYAILAHYVASRRKEIGLRIALGAMAGHLVRLIARHVAPIVLLGLLVGSIAHVALSRWLASLLYEVSTLDPITIAIAAGAVLAMALLAAVTPILHAISVDPARTLRED